MFLIRSALAFTRYGLCFLSRFEYFLNVTSYSDSYTNCYIYRTISTLFSKTTQRYFGLIELILIFQGEDCTPRSTCLKLFPFSFSPVTINLSLPYGFRGDYAKKWCPSESFVDSMIWTVVCWHAYVVQNMLTFHSAVIFM